MKCSHPPATLRADPLRDSPQLSIAFHGMSLAGYLQELRSLAPEKALEPELKTQDRQKQDQKIRCDA